MARLALSIAVSRILLSLEARLCPQQQFVCSVLVWQLGVQRNVKNSVPSAVEAFFALLPPPARVIVAYVRCMRCEAEG